jgi:hypothetical protein
MIGLSTATRRGEMLTWMSSAANSANQWQPEKEE